MQWPLIHGKMFNLIIFNEIYVKLKVLIHVFAIVILQQFIEVNLYVRMRVSSF